MTARVRREDVIPNLPVPSNPRAHVCVVLSLNYPDMDDKEAELVKSFTRRALSTLIERGASFDLWDSTTPLHNPSATADFDGLLMLGGGDVDCTCYGGTTPHPKSYGIDKRADLDALTAIRSAEAAQRPILGICRGNQLLNVARGGTLIGDIEDYTLHHGAPGAPVFVDEPIDITPGTRLHSILQKERAIVRNGHHQAVDQVGEGLVVAGRALDGIVESVEDPTKFYLGVQWHPEEPDAPVEDRLRLFEAFIAAAEQCRQENAPAAALGR